MAIPQNTLSPIYGDATDRPEQPIFTNSNDVSGRYGAGMLLDIDWADPDGAGAYAGTFVAGDKIKNSCADHVIRKLIPSATAADALSMTVGGTFAANQIVVQRSGKGYPHVIVSQVNATTSSLLYLSIPDAVLAYIIANPNNEYRACVTERITRADTNTANSGNAEFSIHQPGQTTANYLLRIEGLNAATSGFRPNSAPKKLGSRASPDLGTTLDEHFKSIGALSFSGTVPTTTANLQGRYGFGPSLGGQARSAIMRRVTLEDMTVSKAALAAAVTAGSTTTEAQGWTGADNRHFANWQARVASTDYYSGDTFNSPASVLA